MSTFALAIGLVVGNLIHPGEGAQADPPVRSHQEGRYQQHSGLPPGNHPRRHPGPAHLLAAILVGFALQKMGKQGAPILTAIGHGQRLVFRILIMIMWLAPPVGAFGAIAAVVGAPAPRRSSACSP